jgi:hypothetical protein
MGNVGKPKLRILVNPLGSSIEVLLPPIAKWQPGIIYCFTSMDGVVDLVKEHLIHSWRDHCGPNGPPEIRSIWIDEPWKENTIPDMMEEFDKIVHMATAEFSNYDIEWHVGITGGTNMMPVAMALSASNHSFPVYYATESRHNQKLAATPNKLVIELPLFTQWGPGVQFFTKSAAASNIFGILLSENKPMTVHEMVLVCGKSEKSIYPHTKALREKNLIKKVGSGSYEPTTVGRLAYNQSRGIK